ncbi:MAG: barstar family protein [Acidobacteriales bacterium]|nr:barstar family protein [Terriglobales bacterium]
MKADLEAHGFRLLLIDRAQPVSDKASLLRALTIEAEFPRYFGFNWDACRDREFDAPTAFP